ncbi:hypothetical protein BEH94_08280 [Candidatus Altiarchaeales archaeon WOR_SM1_SCG]|nr:hypothetical protein BEH94_08280 [Candidatus Altiarchaeales archaeon WOR_SM1_SCG]
MTGDELCKTGINEMDKILGGGIPQGSSVLLAGSSGSGKTILCSEFIFRGASEHDEKGVYICLTEPKAKMIKNLKNFGFYDQKAVDDGDVYFLDMEVAEKLREMLLLNPSTLVRTIVDVVKDRGAKRVVIDSVTAVCNSLDDKAEIRDFIFRLGIELSPLDCTALLISEIPPREYVFSVFGVEEFISDGIVHLSDFERKGNIIRTLQVVKMRGIEHSMNKQVMQITKGGIKLMPLLDKNIPV